MVVGRFQIIHKGHVMMIETARRLCRRCAVFVGSSQESGTEKNPLSFEERQALLRLVFGDGIEIFPLPDIGVGNNPQWGEYVLEKARAALGGLPDLVVSGKEGRRSSWYESKCGDSVAELFVPKTLEISASKMREFLISDDRASFERFSPEELREKYDFLRAAVINSAGKTNTNSI